MKLMIQLLLFGLICLLTWINLKTYKIIRSLTPAFKDYFGAGDETIKVSLAIPPPKFVTLKGNNL